MELLSIILASFLALFVLLTIWTTYKLSKVTLHADTAADFMNLERGGAEAVATVFEKVARAQVIVKVSNTNFNAGKQTRNMKDDSFEKYGAKLDEELRSKPELQNLLRKAKRDT